VSAWLVSVCAGTDQFGPLMTQTDAPGFFTCPRREAALDTRNLNASPTRRLFGSTFRKKRESVRPGKADFVMLRGPMSASPPKPAATSSEGYCDGSVVWPTLKAPLLL